MGKGRIWRIFQGLLQGCPNGPEWVLSNSTQMHYKSRCMFSLPLDDSSWYWSSPCFHQLPSWNLSCLLVYLAWLVLDKVLAPHSFVFNAQQWVQLLNMGLFPTVVCISIWLLTLSSAARPPQHCPDKAFPELDEPRKKGSKPQTLFEKSKPVSNTTL